MTVADRLKPEIFDELSLTDFIALDIETTGLMYTQEEIIEFAAVHFHHGEAVDQISLLIRPSKSIPAAITRLTGIGDADVAGAPSFSEVLPQIRTFLQDFPLVAHNSNFDLPFLEYHARRVHGDFRNWDARDKQFAYFPNPQFDTVLLSRIYLSFLPSFSLRALVDYFQFGLENAHRALPDAEAAGKLFLEIVERAVQTKFADVQKILQILEPTDEPVKTFFEYLVKFLATGKYSVPGGIDRAKFSIQANHYNIIGETERPDFASDNVLPLDPAEVGNFFDEGGALAREFAAFEVREPQVKMARAIAEAFNESQFLLVEAGTGTGKSMAYLLPAIKWAVKNYGPYGRVIVSTNTKNLQEQLFFKDLPILHSILPEKFKAVLLKGKSNYLCLDRWVTVMSDMQSRLTPQERVNLLPLYFWVQETETGDVSENSGFRAERNMGLWTKLIAENNYCSGKACKYYDRCYLMKARNNARDAHLVLVNHSLLFSDLAADNAVLAEYKNVIFDEAHNIEKTATEYLGVEITLWQFRDFLNKLYQKERHETGVLIQLGRRLEAGQLQRSHLDALDKMLLSLMENVSDCRQSVQMFFAELTRMLREKHPAEGRQSYSDKQRYTAGDMLFEAVLPLYRQLSERVRRLQRELTDLIEYFKELPEDSFPYQRQLYQDLNAQSTQAEGLLNNLTFLIDADWDTYVYWYELPYRSDSDDTRLYAAPLDVGGILQERLFDHLKSAVFTSATMAVNKSFDYFQKRSGVHLQSPDRVSRLLLDSPFNYEEQVFLAVPSYLPDPGHPQYSGAVKALLEQLALRLNRGTLVLFTSYAMLNNVYQGIRQTFEAESIPLLGQGIDGGRHAIINRFKTAENAFLLGTDSFWEGIDVPGKALEMVLITKLPFDVPSDPVIQARSELIKMHGGNPFSEFSIPEAVIRFRQGFGRLIRSRSDYGAVIILDNRVVKKFYGRPFLNSLPARARLLAGEAELWEALSRWFGGND